MKKYIDGEYVEMTAEEAAALEQSLANQPEPEPTPEQRIADLEKANEELRDALEALISGVTE